jgi:hypothetical protein
MTRGTLGEIGLVVAVSLGLLLGDARESAALGLAPGELVVVDADAFGGGGVLRVNPVTGAQTTVSSGGSFVEPLGIALAPSGDMFVVDPNAFGGLGGVIRVNPATGAQTTVSSGGSFVGPVGIALAPNGDVFVVDREAFGGPGGVFRVNPATGAQTTVSSGGSFVEPRGIALAPNGDLFVADANAFGGNGGVIRVNPTTGAQTTVSSGGSFVGPGGIALAPNGDLFVVDLDAFSTFGGVIRVNPTTGAQTTVSSAGSFVNPFGIALAPNGDLFVADISAAGRPVIRVDPATGGQTTVSSGGSFASPRGLAVAPPAVVTAAGPGGGPHVRVVDATGRERASFFAYAPGFTGGVRVATGDVNGDGVADVITGPGPGGGPHVQVFDGRALFDGSLVLLHSFFAYPPGFTGGVFVGAVDLTADGKADIVTAAGAGGGPHVRAFDGVTGAALPGPVGSFFAYPPGFTGGVFVTGYH